MIAEKNTVSGLFFSRIVVAIALVLVLMTGCGGDNQGAEANDTEVTETPIEVPEEMPTEMPSGEESDGESSEEQEIVEPAKILREFTSATVNDGQAVEGGVLNVAVVADKGFEGVLNPLLYKDTGDGDILSWITEGVLGVDENYMFNQDGLCSYTYNVETKIFTIRMKDGVNATWHDGAPFTLDDLLFAYEVICSPLYDGIFYDDHMTAIVGASAYKAGTSSSIAGIILSDDKRVLTIRCTEFYPSMLYQGFWTVPLPRHYYGGIPVDELGTHEKTRLYPIGIGAFKVAEVVDGQSVRLERFDDYWQGTPKLDGVLLTVIDRVDLSSAMRRGQFDLSAFDTVLYSDNTVVSNYQYLGVYQIAFNYTGFKLGSWDSANGVNVYNPTAKMADVRLRQAIGYAIDNDTICKEIFDGVRVFASSIVTPSHSGLLDRSLQGYIYDPEKSRQILDEAGYADIDGDGFREDRNGNPFALVWAMMEGGHAEAVAQMKIEQWADVGLKVELYYGKLISIDELYAAIEMDLPEIDMYDAVWAWNDRYYDLNPSGPWGLYSGVNYTRYTSSPFQTIQNDISSEKAWDKDFLTERYKAWQQAFFNEAPAIPTMWRVALYAVNNRVKNYDAAAVARHLIELTADEPYSE